MIQGSFIQQSIRDGSCVLYHDYRLGHARDLSSYGNHGTPGNDIWFARDGFRNRKAGTGVITVAANASLNITTFTAIMLCASGLVSNRATTAQVRIFDKSGEWYIHYADVANAVYLVTSNTRNWTFPVGPKWPGLRYIGMNCQDATITPSYLEGSFAVNLSAVPTFNAIANNPLYIGNVSVTNRGFGRCMSAAMMFNRQLTSTEHARLYGELMK